MITILALILAGLLLATTTHAADPAGAASATARETRHSGTVTAIEKGRLTLEELVAWTGEGTGRVRRTVALTDDTRILLVTRDESPDRASMAGFTETRIDAAAIRPGDFVTVTTPAGNGRAVSVEVVRPEHGS
jgi:hypothetical protein